MSKHKDLVALFHETLKRLRAARRQSAKGLDRMARAATGPALRARLEQAGEATDADRLDAVFAALGKKPHEELCAVTDARLAVVKTMMAAIKGGPELDEGLAAEAAALEGHAAAQLALLRAWADRLELADALPVLDRLRAESELARDGFAAQPGPDGAPPSPEARPALTPKQAALIGLR